MALIFQDFPTAWKLLPHVMHESCHYYSQSLVYCIYSTQAAIVNGISESYPKMQNLLKFLQSDAALVKKYIINLINYCILSL